MEYPLKKVYLELTDICNLECKICFRHQWVEEPTDMPESLWKKTTKQIQGVNSIETIVLGGMGEPLASPLFQQAVNLFKGKEILLTTNGTLIKEKLTKDVIVDLDLIVISIDGMENRMMHDRGVVFKELISSIDYLNQLKQEQYLETPKLDIQFVASKENVQEIFPLMDLLAEKRIRNLVISHFLPQRSDQADNILYQRYDNKPLKELYHKIRNHSFKRGLRVQFPEAELKTERRCAFVSNNATYITSRGEVVPCYRFSHQGSEVVFGRFKTIKQYSFGNLRDNTLLDIWNSEDYVKFRNRIYNNHYPSCPDCDLVEGCSLIDDVDFDCNGEEPNCSDCLWARKIVICT
ncbi:MAG: SPASM domain-containing protein [Bacteroidales bacterium]